MMQRQEVSKECDVYSYSILLWEIITHKLPFSDVIPLTLPMAVIEGKVQCRESFGYNTLLPVVSLSFSFVYDGPQRPPVPDCDVYLQQLMEQCWKTEPKVNSLHIKVQFSRVNY